MNMRHATRHNRHRNTCTALPVDVALETQSCMPACTHNRSLIRSFARINGCTITYPLAWVGQNVHNSFARSSFSSFLFVNFCVWLAFLHQWLQSWRYWRCRLWEGEGGERRWGRGRGREDEDEEKPLDNQTHQGTQMLQRGSFCSLLLLLLFSCFTTGEMVAIDCVQSSLKMKSVNGTMDSTKQTNEDNM